MRELTAVGVAVVLVVALGAVPAAASGDVGGPNGAASVQEACSYPLTVTDATGTEVSLE